jgi:hypothetical protein
MGRGFRWGGPRALGFWFSFTLAPVAAAQAPVPAPAPAPSPAPAADPPPRPAWVRLPEARKATHDSITAVRPDPPAIGFGFHVFDPAYVGFGVNTQSLCQAVALELEGSFAGVTDGMFWGGAYGTAGIQRGIDPGRAAPSERDSCFEGRSIYYEVDRSRDVFGARGDGFRVGAGGEFGWRMLGLDLGYLHNTSLANQDHGFRLRAGLALANELFTGGSTRYGKECCSRYDSVVPCECPRSIVGVSLFLYYAYELYVDRRVHLGLDTRYWGQNSAGLSLKVAFGVGGGC